MGIIRPAKIQKTRSNEYWIPQISVNQNESPPTMMYVNMKKIRYIKRYTKNIEKYTSPGRGKLNMNENAITSTASESV